MTNTDFLTADEVAAMTRLSRRTIVKFALRGDLHGCQLGKVWRFRLADVDAWINRHYRKVVNG